jgi:hypothetical protein
MRGTREWEKTRSTHARVLEALESSIAAHPASGRREAGRPDADRPSTGRSKRHLRVCDAETVAEPATEGTVLRFVPRSRPTSNDAA